jgi:ATP-dependent Lon protease
VADRIREDVREGMDRTQREYLLRQQLAAVREADRLERTPDGSPEGGWIRTCLELAGGRGSGAVLVLLGPPGVGKTSLGESVARALGRAFVRVGPSAGSATRPRSAGTVAPTWVRCPGGSSAPSRRPAR